MKKILIALIVIVGIVAILPIVGNSLAQNILKERVDTLTSNGLSLKNATTESSYLNTKKHYEFLLSDAPKFIEYINQYSNAQLPPYVDAMIGGVVIGVDIEYSNFPLSSKVLVDIYPLSLSTAMMDELKKEDTNFYKYVKNLLESKGVLYHMNYYISDELFDGFIKNIDEKYLFDNGTKINFKITDATYYGQGPLIAPKDLQAHILDINLKVDTPDDSIVFNMHDLSSASTFDSQSTYASSVTIKNFLVLIKETNSGKTDVSVDNMKFNVSSNTQGKKAEFYAKSSLGELKINSQFSNIVASGFNYDISLDGVEKDSYEEFRKLTSHMNASNSPKFEQELQDIVTKVVSKGLTLSIADLSVKSIGVENKKPIDGFSIMAKLTIDEDVDLAKKLKTSPMSLAKNVKLTSTMKFSKDFYALINKEAPATVLAGGFAKEVGNDIIFEIKLIDGNLSINDKVIN